MKDQASNPYFMAAWESIAERRFGNRRIRSTDRRTATRQRIARREGYALISTKELHQLYRDAEDEAKRKEMAAFNASLAREGLLEDA